MDDIDPVLNTFNAAWARWHRAQAALKPHFVAGEVPPEEKLAELEAAVEQLEDARDDLVRAVSARGR